MREIRPYGSARGVRSNPYPYRDPPFFRCEAPRLSQLAIFQHLSLPRMDHFGGLPGAAKQIPNRLPVLHRESESDSVLPSKEKYAPLLVFHDRRVRVEVVALPLAKVPLQIQFLQQPSELRNSRVSNHWIPRGKGSGKLQTRGEFIPLFPHQIEAVSAFFQGGQCRLNRKLKILVVCLRRRLLSQGLSVSGIVAARAHLPQGRPMLPKCIVQLLDIRELFLIKKSIEIPHCEDRLAPLLSRVPQHLNGARNHPAHVFVSNIISFLCFHLFVPWKSHQVYKVQSGILRFADDDVSRKECLQDLGQ